MELWVDVFHPVIHVETDYKYLVYISAQYESWRTEDQIVLFGTRHECFSFNGYP